MKTTDHNKILGILHLAYGGLSVLLMFAISIFMIGMMTALPANSGDAVPTGIFVIVIVFMVVLNLVLVTPSFLAGYALLKRKKWAKSIGIIAGIVAGLSFPLGSALCVYTLWFLFGENGRALYDKTAYALPPGPPVWARAGDRQPEREYVPPSTPPDWR